MIVVELRALAAHAGRIAGAIGQTVKISGLDYTVIGVASREFTGTLPGIAADFWVPLMMVERFVFSGMQAIDRQRSRHDAARHGEALGGCSSRAD